MSIQQFLSLFQHASTQGSRSTALNPMVWLAGMLTAAFVTLATAKTPGWPLVFLAVLLGFGVAGFLAAYAFFARTDPDALRSERFTLSKLALQQSVRGDNIAGIIEGAEGDEIEALPAPQPSDEGTGTPS